MSRVALAYKAGVDISTIQRAESKGKVSLRSLSKMAAVLEVPVGDLFDEVA